MQRIAKESLRITLTYTVFGLVWITMSDRLLNAIFTDPDTLAFAQLAKGWSFILITAALLYLLSIRALTTYQKAFDSDPLTKLLRHDRFKLFLSTQLEQMNAHDQYVLIYFDIDHFSEINKNIGHDSADRIIKKLSRRMREQYPIDVLLGRLAVDQFAIGMTNGEDAVATICESIRETLQAIAIECNCDLKATYGVAIAPQDSSSAKGLMWSASEALRIGKQQNRSQISFYNPDLSAQKMQALQLSRDLRTALADEQLSLVYQPQFTMNKALAGVEVLVRWEHPIKGFISPAEFVPLAEQFGLIDQLTEFVLQRSYRDLLPFLGSQIKRVSVNTSATEINNEALIAKLSSTLAQMPEYCAYLQLEVTETAALENLEFARKQMQMLGKLGVKFSLDDFGTGYSSLSMIKELPLNELKIDRSFIQSMLTDSGAKTIVESVINIAKGYRLVVVAEGVEEQEEFDALVSLGCSEVQGYLLSRPLTITLLTELLDQY